MVPSLCVGMKQFSILNKKISWDDRNNNFDRGFCVNRANSLINDFLSTKYANHTLRNENKIHKFIQRRIKNKKSNSSHKAKNIFWPRLFNIFPFINLPSLKKENEEKVNRDKKQKYRVVHKWRVIKNKYKFETKIDFVFKIKMWGDTNGNCDYSLSPILNCSLFLGFWLFFLKIFIRFWWKQRHNTQIQAEVFNRWKTVVAVH